MGHEETSWGDMFTVLRVVMVSYVYIYICQYLSIVLVKCMLLIRSIMTQ